MHALELSPLVVKELGGMSRRGWTYLVRTAYVVLTALLVYFVAGPAVTGGREIHTSEYAELGRRLFSAFTTLQMFFLPLASAIAACDMLHSEARRGTLSILLLTPLSPAGIVRGKWAAVMLYAGTLALCGMPVLAIAAYLGGVGPEDLLWSLSLSMALSGVTAAMAIYYSVRDGSVVEAAIRAYFLMQISVVPYAMVGGMLAGILGWNGMALAVWTHPTLAWMAAANPARSGALASHGWIGATLFTGYWCRRYLNGAVPPLRATRHGSTFLDKTVRGGPPRSPLGHQVGRRGPIWEGWPLLWKEFATRTLRLPDAYRVLLASLFGLLTVLAVYERPQAAVFQLGLLYPVALLLVVAIGAGHFTQERERRGFEMLLCAPVSAGSIVGAKLLTGLLGAELLTLLGFLTIGYLSLTESWTPAGLALTGATFLVFSYLLASTLSLRSSSYRAAFMGSAGILLFLLVGIPVVTGLLESSPLARSPTFKVAVLVLSPLSVFGGRRGDPVQDLFLPAHLAIYGAASLGLLAGLILRLRAVAQGR